MFSKGSQNLILLVGALYILTEVSTLKMEQKLDKKWELVSDQFLRVFFFVLGPEWTCNP